MSKCKMIDSSKKEYHNKAAQNATETKRSLIVNLLEMALAVEGVLFGYLKMYPVGIYLDNQTDPVLVQGKQYYFEKIVMRDMAEFNHLPENLRPVPYYYEYPPVIKLGQALEEPWDVVDAPEGNIVATHRQLRGATVQPRLPVHGLQIVQELLHNAVFSSLAYMKIASLTVEEIVLPHLEKEYSERHRASESPTLTNMCNLVFENCKEILSIVRQFVGEDIYHMYEFNNVTPTTLSLDKKGDFRVMDWHRRMGEGSWV